jgi:hypothetical protein
LQFIQLPGCSQVYDQRYEFTDWFGTGKAFFHTGVDGQVIYTLTRLFGEVKVCFAIERRFYPSYIDKVVDENGFTKSRKDS